MLSSIRILMIGDVVGVPGQNALQRHLQRLKRELDVHFVVVNGENAADGKGITPRIAESFLHNGADVVTTGNHIWQKKEIYEYLASHKTVLRPINFPSTCPGSGVGFITHDDVTVAVVNVQGRVFMKEQLGCPLRAMESVLTFVRSKTPLVLVDFHAEATSEKHAFAFYFDGKVSAVVGTHTHVQTADERILPEGTAYITDLGMVGPFNSAIGVKKEQVISNMLNQMPVRFEVETEGPMVLCGVYLEVDRKTGKALAIQRIQIRDA